MILRTPPPQRKRKVEPETVPVNSSPASDRRLAIYADPEPVAAYDPASHASGEMVCAYQCRQMMKSEVVNALSSAEKQVVDTRSRLQSLTTELAKSEEERNKFYARLCYVEQELAASKGREKALQERLLNEVHDSQKRFHDQLKCNSELEIKLKEEADLHRKAESSSLAIHRKAASLEEKIALLTDGFEREKKILLKDLSDSQSEARSSCSRLSMELEKMKIKADHAVEESEVLRKELEVLKGRLNEILTQKSQIEVKLSDSISKSHSSSLPMDQALIKHLQEELRNYEAEVLEARKLKFFHANVELLKEKLLEEQARRERAEAELLKLQEMEISYIKLQGELEALRSSVKQIPDISSFDELPLKFASLQEEAIGNMRKVGEINEHLSQLRVALEIANLSKEQTESDHALVKEKAEELVAEVKELKQMLKLVTEERDRLRSTVITKQKGDAESGATYNPDLQKLEMALSEKESSLREMENNLQEQREVINRQHAELILVNEKLNDEARRIKSLEREGDRLRAEISLLESKLGHGDYSSSNTKVLRMVNTLALDNDAKLTIEALQAELDRAQAKLQAVEELKGQTDAGNLIDADISEKISKLKGQIATLEKREERYKTVFADKISVFRRACCLLFGYKIIMDDHQRADGIPVTRFTLVSIYAQADDERLEFEYESGNMNILANDYCSQLEISRQVDIFIKKMNSIPAFTANLTVESFNKRTLC